MRVRAWTGLASAALVALLVLIKLGAPYAWGQERPYDDERVRPAPRTVPQRQWEYRSVVACQPAIPDAHSLEEDLEQALGEHGKRGWELVSLVPPSELSLLPNVRGRRDEARNSRYCWLAVFKREQAN